MKVVKCLSHCMRLLRERASQQIFARRCISHCGPSCAWTCEGFDRRCRIYQGFRSKREVHDDRYNWRDPKTSRTQSGMDTAYERPDYAQTQPRYDDKYYTPSGYRLGNAEGDEGRYDDRAVAAQQRNEERVRREAQRRYDFEETARRNREVQMAEQPTASQKSTDYFNSFQDVEMRRRPTKQGSIQHRQMQERIIEENKRKWLNRPEPKREINAPGVIYQLKNPLYAAEKIHLHHGGGAGGGKNRRGQGDDKAAEEYSRRRRAQRLKELKRQERELQKSRRGYKFPRAEGDSAPEGRMKDNVSQQETEAQYWHSWQTCPDERRMFKTEEEMSDAEPSSGYGKTDAQQPGLVRPPHPYDGSRRRFQTASLQQAARLDLAPKALEERAMWRTNGIKPPSYDMRVKRRASRKLTSMEKQYQLAYDLTDGHKRRRSSVADAKVQQSQIKMPMPQKMWRNPVPDDDEVELIDMELPHQPPRKKMSWNGMPQWWHKRFNKGKRSRSNDFEDAAEERDEAPKVKPPRYRMTVQSKALKRMRVPVQSFSERLRIVPRNTPHSEYTGYSRPTVCDQWESFKSGMISKSIY